MTKEEIKNVVLTHVNRDDKIDLIYTAIDLGLRQINQRWAFKQSRLAADTTVTQGQQSFSLPDNCLQIVGLRIKFDGTVTGAGVITVLPKHRVQQLYPRLADQPDDENLRTGRPIYAYEEMGQLFMIPSPANEYTIEVTYDVLETLDATSDSPSSVNLDEALIAYATSYVYKSIQMLTDASYWDQQYERALAIAMRADDRKTAQHRQMRGAEQHGKPYIYDRDYRINDYTPT